MEISHVNARLDAMAKAMQAKGLGQQVANCDLSSFVAPSVFLKWKVAGASEDASPKYQWFDGGDLSSRLDAADAWIAALPEPEEHHRAELLRLAAMTADYAAEHLPGDTAAAEIRATIVAGMQRLSDNALMHTRAG